MRQGIDALREVELILGKRQVFETTTHKRRTCDSACKSRPGNLPQRSGSDINGGHKRPSLQPGPEIPSIPRPKIRDVDAMDLSLQGPPRELKDFRIGRLLPGRQRQALLIVLLPSPVNVSSGVHKPGLRSVRARHRDGWATHRRRHRRGAKVGLNQAREFSCTHSFPHDRHAASDLAGSLYKHFTNRSRARQVLEDGRPVDRGVATTARSTCSERQKLVRAFYADAIPVELLRREQQRIDDEPARCPDGRRSRGPRESTSNEKLSRHLTVTRPLSCGQSRGSHSWQLCSNRLRQSTTQSKNSGGLYLSRHLNL